MTKLGIYIFMEFVLVLCLLVVLTTPILDYAKRETLAYMRDPSPTNLAILQAKRADESKLRLRVSLPFGLLMLILAFPLYSEFSRIKTKKQ